MAGQLPPSVLAGSGARLAAGCQRFRFVSWVVLTVALSVGSTASAYAIEREAVVELLPNDLIESVSPLPDPPAPPEANQTVSTPQQVIENQIVKIAEALHRTMEDTRRHLRQTQRNNGKRDLGTENNLPYLIPLMACFVKLVNSGMVPQIVLKELVKIQGSSSGGSALLGSKKAPTLCSLAEGRQPNALLKALAERRAGGVVTDLTGGSRSHVLPGALAVGASSTGLVGVPSTDTAGVSLKATAVGAGAGLGLAMAGAGALTSDMPVAGGTVQSVPLAATGPLSRHSEVVDGFDVGYRAGMAVGSMLSRI